MARWRRRLSGWLARLEVGLAGIGLDLRRDKCKATPMDVGGTAEENRGLFGDCVWVGDGNFKVLGAAFGSGEYCTGQLRRRMEKVERLMEIICELEDPQTALTLLRHCAGYARVVYSTRVFPQNLQQDALEGYSTAL